MRLGQTYAPGCHLVDGQAVDVGVEAVHNRVGVVERGQSVDFLRRLPGVVEVPGAEAVAYLVGNRGGVGWLSRCVACVQEAALEIELRSCFLAVRQGIRASGLVDDDEHDAVVALDVGPHPVHEVEIAFVAELDEYRFDDVDVFVACAAADLDFGYDYSLLEAEAAVFEAYVLAIAARLVDKPLLGLAYLLVIFHFVLVGPLFFGLKDSQQIYFAFEFAGAADIPAAAKVIRRFAHKFYTNSSYKNSKNTCFYG